MGYFKNLELEIREMDSHGMPVQQIADHVGLNVKQILDLLDDGIDNPYEHADESADLDVVHYGSIQ